MFKDFLGAGKAIVAYHKPNNLKDLAIPRKMIICNETYLKSSTYVENQTGNIIGVAVKDKLKEIVLDDGVSMGMIER